MAEPPQIMELDIDIRFKIKICVILGSFLSNFYFCKKQNILVQLKQRNKIRVSRITCDETQ